ncbi:MAG: hypothetical protein A4S09_04515 [Proteobacteria bacterium SG_bin7]|nr:MAG: hypothetical protein A4S09_04515 [Proteobacteria bacterium SG_bin7]
MDIRKMVMAAMGTALLLGAAGSFSPQTEEKIHVKIKIEATKFKDELQKFRDRHFDIAGVSLKASEVGLVVSREDLRILRNEGFAITKESLIGASLDTEFKDPSEIESILRGFADKYPNLTSLMSLGKTEQGRDIWALKISNKNSFSKFKKPTFYINGMHHAREVMSPEVPLDMIEYLLANYGADRKVTHWVDQNEIYAVPMVNPDGNNVVWTNNNWWRKNVSRGYGVDINRNYPYMWGQCRGSSGNKGADDYRGPSAGSENETNAIVELIKNIRPVASLSLHSYSELVLYPMSCQGQHAAHKDFFMRVGGGIAKQIPVDGGGRDTYTSGTPWELLYSVDGGDIDWLYSDFGVMPFVIEMNQEFQPSYSQYRDKTVKKLRVAWMTLLDLLDGSGVRGKVSGEQEVVVKNLSAKKSWTDYTYKADMNGNFHILLEPGVYEVNGRKVVVEQQRVDL